MKPNVTAGRRKRSVLCTHTRKCKETHWETSKKNELETNSTQSADHLFCSIHMLRCSPATLLLATIATCDAYALAAAGCSRTPVAATAALRLPGGAVLLPLHSRARSVRMEEYSTKVKMTVETRSPFRQGRIFFLYPSTIAGAGIAAYVAVTRLAAGMGGFRTDTVPLNDAGNLLIDAAIVAAAVYFLRGDLKSREDDLEAIRVEMEGPPDADAGGED